ncbi:S9 family peptidase [Flavobacterium sp. CBA20B-1]|uniref:S9 family peptidase n=1 Tax=unclassified Flavobacterium TaxID=196869 RepID=UPI0022244BC6|nr:MULTISPECIES: S9 family peptidase [unclassified Flavobacterium]WCM43438.1 S9 family peptidase [Flavobacterium sp. CBA20B-1]
MKRILVATLSVIALNMNAQEQVLTKELLWQLGRVNPIGITEKGDFLIYKVGIPNVDKNTMEYKIYQISIDGKNAKLLESADGLIKDRNLSPDGKFQLSTEEVKVNKVLGKDRYPELKEANVYVYDGLDYRHWDKNNDGSFNHVIVTNLETNEKIDLLQDEPYYSPQAPFGGEEDYIWHPSGKSVIYVSKKKAGTAYATSTNTDLYEYYLDTKQTVNLTEKNLGYDTHPTFSPNGDLTWLQMKNDGYEADKNDIIVRHKGIDINLTSGWDGTVNSYVWSNDGKKVYFIAPVDGTNQLFEVNFPGLTRIAVTVKQLTNGVFDVASIVGFANDKIVVTRTDFNSAAELYSFDLKKATWNQITHVNDATYSKIAKSKIDKRYVTTTDGKKMLVWVILPPNFDPNKKYPTLLYCQGGPQSMVSPFYSFRWNFQLMAAEGYVIVAPNRRGLPGFGVEWNEAISKDWGGQAMDDYLSAIDALSKEKYVDSNRLGAVGASYGGYSVYYLAGIHENRFKTFIAHCGVFNLESMYGTTEEVFFTNWDAGGAYWEKDNAVAQKTYSQFNPKNNVAKWNTPILIFHGGKDYRVPIGQGQEAFAAAQLQGIKSRFVYLPDENHWVLKPQNALVWQTEFFKWLKETL